MIEDVYLLTPPFFSTGALRIDSPAASFPDAYKLDTAFFAAHSHRRQNIRKIQFKEFDPPFELGDWMQVPQLWVWVNRLALGVHSITPVYRGRSFFTEDLQSDEQVITVLLDMQRRGGISEPEFRAFAQRNNERLAQALASSNQKAVN